MNYQEIFYQNIERIKQEGRYRNYRVIDKNCDNFPKSFEVSQNKHITIWCSNDYLGMSSHKQLIEIFIETAKRTGVGSGGTRNISGTTVEIANLEDKISAFHGKEAGLVFTSGYVSNLATISAITQIIPEIVIFSDAKNHASIISGIRHNKVKKHVFEHNNIKHLEELILQYPVSQPKIIIFEGVYSMDASTPNIPAIVDIAKKYNALTYIDEVHAVGLYGNGGRGIADYYNVSKEIDIIEGTFAKSFGVLGGYIACNKLIRDAIRLNGSSFIFTTSLPPAICSAISKSIDIIASEEGNILRKKHFEISDFIKSGLNQHGIEFLQNLSVNTHIIPVMINDAKRAEEISTQMLRDFNIYVQHINYPTVPIGQERLRITCSSNHTLEMAENLISALSKVFKK